VEIVLKRVPRGTYEQNDPERVGSTASSTDDDTARNDCARGQEAKPTSTWRRVLYLLYDATKRDEG